ncbi:hypothetical protein HanPSC8_Chr08g0311721 [Helianthus annuus]|nr:hypothetical protein HanPSC8_Chr08g0311721 [Helianthus annuus]
MSSSSISQETLNRQQLYRLTNRILTANLLHFILISLLFLPFTFSASSAVHFYFSPSSSSPPEFDPFNLILFKTIITSSQNLLTLKTLITILAFACFVILPTVAGIALIIYSTNQAMQRKALTFFSTLKSLRRSYIPLLYTVVAGAISVIILFLAFTLSAIIVNKGVKALGLGSDIYVVFSIFVNLIVSYALAFVVLFFITIWGSAPAITVLESNSGFKALKQSANQTNEFRRHAFSIVFVTGYGFGSAMACSAVLQDFVPVAKWVMIVSTGAVNLLSLVWILPYVVANTVLYVQYKVASGGEIVMMMVEEEVSGEYVRLPVNDREEPANEKANYLLYLLLMFIMISVSLGLAIEYLLRHD